MPLSDIVNVTITTTNPGVQQAGFGVPLLATPSPSWVERTRTYTGIVGVAGDFATTSPEYLAAAAIFAQNPAPPQIVIGRLANANQQVWTIGVNTVVSTAGQKYTVNAFYNGVKQTATFTTVGADTNDTIVAGLVSAINALASPALPGTAVATGTVGSKVITWTATASKTWTAFEVTDLNLLTLLESQADAGVVADLTAIALENPNWYGLLLLFKSTATVLAAAGWTETNNRLLFAALPETLAATSADGSDSTSCIKQLKSAARVRTATMYHPRSFEFADCAEVGRFFPLNPGSENWRLKTLSGVTPAGLTSTQITNLKAKYANFYYLLAGVNVIGGDGKVMDNEFIDVIRFRDWWVARMQTRLANLLINANKVPYTDPGIALIEAEVRAQNDEGIAAGGIAASPKPTVSVPAAASVPAGDKSTRTLNNVNTTWTLAGAINFLQVNAQVST